MNPRARWNYAGRAGPAVLLAGITVALYLVNPAETGFLPPCPFHYLTGWHCSGCGSLRAIHQLLHGRPAAAFSLNPLAVAVIPFIGMLLLKPAWSRLWWLPWTVLLVIIAYGVARNLGG